MKDTFFTIKEVSDLLKVSVSTIRRSVRSQCLPVVRIGSQRQIRISQSALEGFISGAVVSQDKCESTSKTNHLSGSTNNQNDYGSEEKRITRTKGVTSKGKCWEIINADVRHALETIPSESVNCAITSPPYYWQRDYEVEGQIGHEASIKEYVEVMVDTFRELRRTLTKDGTFFLNLGDTYYSAKGKPHGKDSKHNGRQMMRRQLRAVDGPGLGLPRKSLIGIPWRVALAMQEDGWTLRSNIIWQRPATLPEPTAKDRPWRTYEHVFLFSKSPRYWFNRDGLNGEEDVWTIVSRPENPGSHFAPYPRELVARCLDCGCPEEGRVLDPFLGSGTTMYEALSRGYSAIGIDLKKEYCDFASERIIKELGKLKKSDTNVKKPN